MEALPVLAGVYKATRPDELPILWGFLEPSCNVRRSHAEPKVLAAELAKQFDPAALKASGVYRSDGSLSPVLSDPNARLLFLREKPDALPFDIVSRSGSLRSNDPPYFDSLDANL